MNAKNPYNEKAASFNSMMTNLETDLDAVCAFSLDNLEYPFPPKSLNAESFMQYIFMHENPVCLLEFLVQQ